MRMSYNAPELQHIGAAKALVLTAGNTNKFTPGGPYAQIDTDPVQPYSLWFLEDGW